MAEIAAPLPGTFYRRPSPDTQSYVDEGGAVAAGDVVGLVEVMKTFVEIRADAPGVVERFLVADGDAVEAGQALLSLLPP